MCQGLPEKRHKWTTWATEIFCLDWGGGYNGSLNLLTICLRSVHFLAYKFYLKRQGVKELFSRQTSELESSKSHCTKKELTLFPCSLHFHFCALINSSIVRFLWGFHSLQVQRRGSGDSWTLASPVSEETTLPNYSCLMYQCQKTEPSLRPS
jgi:hypothetical protein